MINIIESGRTADNMFRIEELGLRAHSYSIEPPQLQTNYIEIPGRDGALDLTEALGKLSYRNRTVKFSGLFNGPEDLFHSVISEIMNRFDGRYIKAVFDPDREHYWTGRCTVTHEYIEKEVYGVTFTLIADPFKYGLYAADEDWLWDPFNFNTGVIRTYKNIAVNDTREVTVIGYDREVTPVITASAAMTLQVKKHGQALWDTYNLTAGENVPDGLNIISTDPQEDYYTFKFTSTETATVTISMREVSL